MNGNIENEGKRKVTKMQLTITLIIVLSLCITGATYAYFAISATNTNTITGNAATVNLTLDVTKVFPTASTPNTGAMIPQLTGNPLSTALKNGCVDGNTNVVCQVYKISIANVGGTATQVVDGRIYFYSDSAMTTDISTTMPDLKWKLITSVDTATPENSVIGSDTDRVTSSSTSLETNEFVSDLTLANGDSEEYYIIVWINETNLGQDAQEGQSFYGKVLFDSSNGTGVTSTFQS